LFSTLRRTSSDLSDSTLLSRPTSLPLPDPSLPEESDTFPVPPTKRDDVERKPTTGGRLFSLSISFGLGRGMRRMDELVFTSDCGSGYTVVVSLCFQVDVTDMHYDGTRKILDRSW
jgi:hypothetical protein